MVHEWGIQWCINGATMSYLWCRMGHGWDMDGSQWGLAPYMSNFYNLGLHGLGLERDCITCQIY